MKAGHMFFRLWLSWICPTKVIEWVEIRGAIKEAIVIIM